MSAPVSVAGARVGVIGLGRSGRAAARLLAERGAEVYASDRDASDVLRETAAALAAIGIEAEAGGHDPARLARCDWLVASPGIPPAAEVFGLAEVRDKPVFGEVEVASWFASAPVAAVTGTNGKTTTTALLGAVARAGGIRASVAGNIGRAFSDAVREDADAAWYVLEVSSFQLARIASFRPRVAVVLNLTPDHLDVYPDMAAYAADKARIVANQGPGDHLAVSAEDPALAGFGVDRPVLRHAFDRRGPVARGAGVEEGWIALYDEPTSGRILLVDRLALPGAHNLQNALAAALAGALMGVGAEAIAEALAGFRGVPHRLETVAEADGVRWVNDSKATNVDAALVGIQAFEGPLVAIVGGRHKGSPYAPLVPELEARARVVLAIGEAAPLVVEALAGRVAVEEVGTLERAVERAREAARPGDTVLLSPACSSYDQFADYEERGDRFRALAREATAAAAGEGGR